MEKKKRIRTIIITITILIGAYCIHLVAPMNVELNIYPPNNSESNITVYVNDEMVYSKYFVFV